MQIKTVTTTDGVNTVNFGNTSDKFYWIKNVGTTTVYASTKSDVAAGADGTAEITAGSCAKLENYDSIIYISGAGKVEIHETNNDVCPFKFAPVAGGGGGGSTITVDSELSDTSINPVQNKVITNNLNSILTEISIINNTLDNLPTGNVTVTLFDNANYAEYVDNWKMLVDQWGDTEYTLRDAITHTPSICNSDNDYQLKLSSDIGWSANIQMLCTMSIELKNNSILKINYNCSTTGSDISIDVLTEADFNAEPVATFDNIPSFYVENNAYLLINVASNITESGNYYLKFNYNTTNPIFLIKSIKTAT
jgi:hypothetical protein